MFVTLLEYQYAWDIDRFKLDICFLMPMKLSLFPISPFDRHSKSPNLLSLGIPSIGNGHHASGFGSPLSW